MIPPIAATLPDTEVAVTGITAGTYDFNPQMRSRLPWVFAFVLGLAFVLLLLTFRSLVIAAHAVALNLLSVGAAYGILVAVFQHGWLADVFGFQTNGAIVSWLPLFLFVILFGLSMDYHVFILSRIKELHDTGAWTDDAVGLGITRTAGTVTSAAIIMVAVFGLFASLSMILMQQMGFGLAVAVLIDATVDPGRARARHDEAARRVELVRAALADVASLARSRVRRQTPAPPADRGAALTGAAIVVSGLRVVRGGRVVLRGVDCASKAAR